MTILAFLKKRHETRVLQKVFKNMAYYKSLCVGKYSLFHYIKCSYLVSDMVWGFEKKSFRNLST